MTPEWNHTNGCHPESYRPATDCCFYCCSPLCDHREHWVKPYLYMLRALLPRRDWWWNLGVEWYALQTARADNRYRKQEET